VGLDGVDAVGQIFFGEELNQWILSELSVEIRGAIRLKEGLHHMKVRMPRQDYDRRALRALSDQVKES